MFDEMKCQFSFKSFQLLKQALKKSNNKTNRSNFIINKKEKKKKNVTKGLKCKGRRQTEKNHKYQVTILIKTCKRAQSETVIFYKNFIKNWSLLKKKKKK